MNGNCVPVDRRPKPKWNTHTSKTRK